MNLTSETSTSPLSTAQRRRARRGGSPGSDATSATSASALERLTLVAILALAAVMNVYNLSQNGYANGFYSAGVKAMLRSLHNFVFVSSDPGGLITIDKPPLSLWLQVASAKVFGFSPMSLLLPEAIAGVLSVLVIYLALSRPLGRQAALMGATALAIFPSFVAVSRDNNPDALLILLLSIACWLGMRASSSGRLRTLLACAIVVGLAFNTKTLAACLVVPGIALAYVLCAPEPLVRRIGKLLLAGVLLAAISLVWLVYVDATPATHRPWVGSTNDNSELSLAFEYNGFGRLDGQSGGPNEIPLKPGAFVPLSEHAPKPAGARRGAGDAASRAARRRGAAQATGGALANGTGGVLAKRPGSAPATTASGVPAKAGARASAYPSIAQAPQVPEFLAATGVPPAPPPAVLPDGRDSKPVPFARAPGLLRLFEGGLGTQAGWLVPIALLGMLALALLLWRAPQGAEDVPQHAETIEVEGRREQGWSRLRDPRLPLLLVFGGWFLIEALFLSVAKGIVHPYYTSEIAPGAAAMVGAGLASCATLIRRDRRWWALLLAAVALTTVAEVAIFDNNNYMEWFGPVLIVAAALAALAVLVLRARSAALWLTLGVLSIAPAVYAAATWWAPVNGTFPAAGPRGAAGYGGVDVNPEELHDYDLLLKYLARQHVGTRFSVLTVSSVASSALILKGSDAASLAGYSGTDPAVSAGRLAAMVKHGEARYVLLGGPYSSRGGNGATKAAIKACTIVPPSEWGVPRLGKYSFTLLDCAGRADALAAS